MSTIAFERFKPAKPMAPPVRMEARAWVLLLGLATVIAGCTSAPPPEPQGPGGVNLTAGEGAAAGDPVSLTWEVQGDASGIDHSELHYGPGSIADPTAGVYPSTATGVGNGGGRYTAQATMPAGGLFARAHVIGHGKAVWSEEVRVAAMSTEPRFTDVQVPATIEAGVPFVLRYRGGGEGTSTHVGSHFSMTSSASMPPGFAAGNWSGNRASQHLGTPQAVTFPAEVAVNVTLPTPGTWYLRPHATVGANHHWGEQVTLTAVNPSQPNIAMLTANSTAIAGEPVRIVFQLNSQPTTSTHVGAHFSQNSSRSQPPGFAPTNWTNLRTAPHHGVPNAVSLPGQFQVNITFPLPGIWYYRAHASVGGQNVWADEVTVAVAPPMQQRVIIASAPTNYTYTTGLGVTVQPITVEWAVLTPIADQTVHTHVHHGPASVANPTEFSGYPASTAVIDNATTPQLFKANFTPPAVQGPYYLRAMAILRSDEGMPVEVWSDEWIINIQLRST